MFTGSNLKLAEELLEAIWFFSKRGWTPATSTNYSFRSVDSKAIIISLSGVDKSRFQLSDLILVDPEGNLLPPFNQPGMKSSAETEIHTSIYQNIPEANCVLHTHSVAGTVLSHILCKEGRIKFEGLELLKGLEGNTTHEMSVSLPIVPNSQEMRIILKAMEGRFSEAHGFLIAGHGLYSWGKDIASAKRHIETFEFLFECYMMMRKF
jgi:methylthioribulose-1-phosphate dehydratase